MRLPSWNAWLWAEKEHGQLSRRSMIRTGRGFHMSLAKIQSKVNYLEKFLIRNKQIKDDFEFLSEGEFSYLDISPFIKFIKPGD